MTVQIHHVCFAGLRGLNSIPAPNDDDPFTVRHRHDLLVRRHLNNGNRFTLENPECSEFSGPFTWVSIWGLFACLPINRGAGVVAIPSPIIAAQCDSYHYNLMGLTGGIEPIGDTTG